MARIKRNIRHRIIKAAKNGSHAFIIAVLTMAIPIDITAKMPDMSPSTSLRLWKTKVKSRAEEPAPYIPILIEIAEPNVADELEQQGVIIFNSRDNILLACVPTENVDQIIETPGIISIEMSGDMRCCLNDARQMSNVDLVQEGVKPLLKGYEGEGIVTGIVDTGFDATHIAFKDRISAIYDYDANIATRKTAETPQEIALWTTDDPEYYHATHVGNILAGAYTGNEYYGVSKKSEFVVSTSRLSDVGILAGLEDIIAYAKKVDKRAVVNMSLGSYLGPHDGTDLLCRYLSSCAKEAVICLSAGNTGHLNSYAQKFLTNDTDPTRIMVNSLSTYNGYEVKGQTEIWGADDRPFDFRIEVFDIDSKEIVFATDWISTTQEWQSITLDPQQSQEWGKYMNGKVIAEAGISSANNRCCVSAYYDTQTEEGSTIGNGRWSKYYTSLAVKGDTGTDENNPTFIQYFPDNIYSYLSFANHEAEPEISSDGTISNMCTAPGVIAVGSCNSRNNAPSIFEPEQTWNYAVNTVSNFTSYSTAPLIQRLPHFAAPGNKLVSAMSSQYLEAHTYEDPTLAAIATIDGKDYYWAAEGGTSMASPLVAGIISTWIEANPALTTQEIIQLAQTTAKTDYSDIDNPRWGAGCIDAYAGLVKAIELNSIIKPTFPPMIQVTADKTINITNPDGTTPSFRIYTPSGTQYPQNMPLPTGIYILWISGHQPIKISI